MRSCEIIERRKSKIENHHLSNCSGDGDYQYDQGTEYQKKVKEGYLYRLR